jgi:tetratricopeptide (TPR) repeat protein
MTDRRSASAASVASLSAGEPVRNALKREQALFTRHRYAQALSLLSALLERPDLKPKDRFEALCRKAECLEHVRRPRESVRLLREIARAFPHEPLGHSLLGEYLYRIMGDHAGALRSLSRALSLSPRDADSWWWKGQVYELGLADLSRARRCYQAALDANPRYAAAMESLAQVSEAQGRWIEAVDWRKTHYRRTRSPGDLVQLAELYLRLDNPVAAMKYARSATRRAGGDPAAWLADAKAHAAGRRFARAVRSLKRFARLASPDAGPFVTSRDLGFLEPVLDRPDVRRLLPRLPQQ